MRRDIVRDGILVVMGVLVVGVCSGRGGSVCTGGVY